MFACLYGRCFCQSAGELALSKLVSRHLSFPEDRKSTNESCWILLRKESRSANSDTLTVANEVSIPFRNAIIQMMGRIDAKIDYSFLDTSTIIPILLLSDTGQESIDSAFIQYNGRNGVSIFKPLQKMGAVRFLSPIIIVNTSSRRKVD
jgi:hypothetical protein